MTFRLLVVVRGKRENWSEKELHGHYIRQTRELAGSKSWSLLKVRDLNKEETECLITTAQDQPYNLHLIMTT